MSDKKKILWVDDEVEQLKSHIIFLEEKGYEVVPASNGDDAVSLVSSSDFDCVLLDEMMPGKDGLETMEEIKRLKENLPVVMVTKSEAEDLMDEAIGKHIADFLIKPISPTQIVSTLKRVLESKKIIEERIVRDYVAEWTDLRSKRALNPNFSEWGEIWRKLAMWDIELDRYRDVGLKSSQEGEKKEANIEFARFIEENYAKWLRDGVEKRPILSVDIVREFLVPHLMRGEKVYFVVMDCMRLDQWMGIAEILQDYFEMDTSLYYSILPTATPYSRNAIFSGLFPIELSKTFPNYWNEYEWSEASKNRNERQLLDKQLERLGVKLPSGAKYVKIFNVEEALDTKRHLASYYNSPLVSIVVNFVDILVHARSTSEVLEEIAPDEAGFRTLTSAWFSHSALFDILKLISKQKCIVILTSDHGSMLGERAAPAFGDRETSPNLRYKFGSNVNCDDKYALIIKNPSLYKLPDDIFNKKYIIAKEDYYLVYPTKFEEYKKEYFRTFQHGGISMEEMILPVTVMRGK